MPISPDEEVEASSKKDHKKSKPSKSKVVEEVAEKSAKSKRKKKSKAKGKGSDSEPLSPITADEGEAILDEQLPSEDKTGEGPQEEDPAEAAPVVHEAEASSEGGPTESELTPEPQNSPV